MKRMYIALALVILLLTLYFVQCKIVSNTVSSLKRNMTQSVELLNSGAYDLSAQKAKIAGDDFKNNVKVLKIFVDEDKLESVEVSISRFAEFAKHHSKTDANAEYQNYIIALEQISENATLLGELCKRL